MDDEKVIEIIEKSLKVPDLSPMKAIAREKTGMKIFGDLLSCIPFALAARTYPIRGFEGTA